MIPSFYNSYVTFLVFYNTFSNNFRYSRGRKSQNTIKTMNVASLTVIKNSNSQRFF